VNSPSAAGLLLVAATAAAPGAAAPVDYVLTPTHSFVHFEWDHAGLSTLRGRFDKASGRVTLDRAGRQGKGLVEVRLDSVNTGRPALDQALRQALGAEGQALARFEIAALGFEGERPVSASGRLSWRDRALEIRLDADHFNCYLNPLLRREVCGGEFSATLETQALGLRLDPAFGLGRTVVLRVQVEAIRQEPTP
jgi:polyisoprenoid-binding protein YceI